MFDGITSLDWHQPLWFLAVLQPLLLWLLLRWKQAQQQQNFADEHLLPWIQVQTHQTLWQKIFSSNMAYSLAWLLFALSLAGPRLPDNSNQVQNDTVLDLMLVVDVSRSMQATDIKPSRLRRASLEIIELLGMANNTRMGITVYAGRPHLLSPLTTDFKALNFYLKSLDRLQLPTLGSDASQALRFAQKELLSQNPKHKQVIVWMTDGDIPEEQLELLKNNLLENSTQGVDTYILGLATEEGVGIPISGGNWLEDKSGKAIISKLDKTLITTLAKLGNGKFRFVTNDDSDWKALYQQGIMDRIKSDSGKQKGEWRELYYWTLLPAILFLIIALFPLAIRKNHINSVLFFIIVSFFINSHSTVSAETYDGSLDNKKSYQISVKQGIELYKKAQFESSKSQFIESVLVAKTKQQRAVALHNLGNALFQTGDYARAAEVFTDALRYAPKQQQSDANQKLSIAINIELEKRKQRLTKKGNLNVPNDSSALFDLPEQIPFMLNTRVVSLLKISLPKLPDSDLNRLLDKSIQQFQLLQGSTEEQAKKDKEQFGIEQARIYFMGLEEQQSNDLWKRLFEVEEGFPGKLKKPKQIPGVQPW